MDNKNQDTLQHLKDIQDTIPHDSIRKSSLNKLKAFTHAFKLTRSPSTISVVPILPHENLPIRNSMEYLKVLSKALKVISQLQISSIPTSSSIDTIINALNTVCTLLKQTDTIQYHRDDETTLSIQDTIQVETALRRLWARIVCYEMHIALMDIISAIEPLPHALKFWRLMQQREKTLRGKYIPLTPFEWLQPKLDRITIQERINAIESTMHAHFVKIGMIKQFTTKYRHIITSDAYSPSVENGKMAITNEELYHVMKEGIALLSYCYSSNGVHAPRQGYGLYLKLDRMTFQYVQIRSCSLPVLADHACLTGKDIMFALEDLQQNLTQCNEYRTSFQQGFHSAMKPCKPPSPIKQRWVQVGITTLAITCGGVWILNNQEEFKSSIYTFKKALEEFFVEHLIAPVNAIVGEVFFNRKQDIQDVAALLDTKESLKRMLGDFVKDSAPQTSPEEIDRILNDMDMSVVSIQFESQLRAALRNIVTGDIVRMLLIQVQFIKKELMTAMGAIDELMHANEFNLQVMATVPSFMLIYVMYSAFKTGFTFIMRFTRDRLTTHHPNDVAQLFRQHVRAIERLLNKQMHRDLKSRQSTTSRKRSNQELQELGALVFQMHELRSVYNRYQPLIYQPLQYQFEEDMTDLMEDEDSKDGDVQIPDKDISMDQKMAVVQRMYHNYGFLHPRIFHASDLLI